MYRYFLTIAVCFLTFLFSACGSRKQTDSQLSDSTAITTETAPMAPASTPIIGRLADLGLTSDSDWRGINIGDDFDKIKATEKGEAFESDATHVGYTIEFKNLETADILYYQIHKKVSTINVDLFLNSGQSVADYQKELTPYFTSRYGAPKIGNGESLWKGPKGETVTLKDVSKGKDFGLKIKISPSADVPTASAK